MLAALSVALGIEGETDEAHQCVIVIFLLAAAIVVLLGASHTHAMVVRHRVTEASVTTLSLDTREAGGRYCDEAGSRAVL